jgi:hypothetical protein
MATLILILLAEVFLLNRWSYFSRETDMKYQWLHPKFIRRVVIMKCKVGLKSIGSHFYPEIGS